jgi:hypothetical protein
VEEAIKGSTINHTLQDSIINKMWKDMELCQWWS